MAWEGGYACGCGAPGMPCPVCNARGRTPPKMPPAITRAFVDDMRAYFAEEDAIKRDAIAARQQHALSEFQSSRQIKLRLSDVKRMLMGRGLLGREHSQG
jgi:hypothetical protein